MDGQTRIDVRLLLRIDREIPATDLASEHILNLRKYIKAGQAIVVPDHIDELFAGRKPRLFNQLAWENSKVALGSVPATCNAFHQVDMESLKKAVTDIALYFEFGNRYQTKRDDAIETDTSTIPVYIRTIKGYADNHSRRWGDLRRALQGFSRKVRLANVSGLIQPKLSNKDSEYPLRIWSQQVQALEAIHIIQDALQSLIDWAEEITAACNFIVEHMEGDQGSSENVIAYALEVWGKMNTLAKVGVEGFAE